MFPGPPNLIPERFLTTPNVPRTAANGPRKKKKQKQKHHFLRLADSKPPTPATSYCAAHVLKPRAHEVAKQVPGRDNNNGALSVFQNQQHADLQRPHALTDNTLHKHSKWFNTAVSVGYFFTALSIGNEFKESMAAADLIHQLRQHSFIRKCKLRTMMLQDAVFRFAA